MPGEPAHRFPSERMARWGPSHPSRVRRRRVAIARAGMALGIAFSVALAATSCSGGDDDRQGFVSDDRTSSTTEDLLESAAPGGEVAALEQATNSLQPGPTPIGPNTTAILTGPPFEGLSSLATGCVLGQQDDEQRDLFAAAISSQRLVIDDVIALRAPAAECAPDELAAYFGNKLTERTEVTLNDASVGCMTTLLSGGRDSYLAPLAGLTAIDLDRPVPEYAAVPTIDGLTACFGAESVSETVRILIAENPAIGAAADLDCVNTNLAQPNASRGYWSRFVQYSAFEPELVPAEADAIAWSPLESCFSIGQLVNAVTTNYGFTLSPTAVMCVDEAATDRSIVGRVLSDNEPDPAEFAELLNECATPEELAALEG